MDVELKEYPSGGKYYRLSIGKDLIGSVSIVVGGYLAPRKRKPVKTLEEAAKQILDNRMNQCMVEHERLRKMLSRVLSEAK